ncbi:MAG TPA: M3 family metallopeptidase [Thermoanaerobaculia bacterium]|nr:M3 family metallopeptidase [Thermoanaerobaculia bacterium]
MKRTILTLAVCFAALACTQTQTPAPKTTPAPAALSASNPFFAPSPLQDQAPLFDKIKDSDYQPAFEEGMRQNLADMERIAHDPQAPTFANTIEAMERSGALLTRVAKVFFNLTASNTNDALQKVEAEMAPKLAAHQDAISLNPALFARVKAIYDQRDSLGLDTESKTLVERYYRNFVRAGALLNEADKTKLRALNQEESTLTTQFREKVLDDTDESAVVVDNKADLDGMSDGDIDAAAQRAKEKGLTGKYVLALQNTTQQPQLASLKNRAVRQRLLEASEKRGNHGGKNDTTAIVTRLAQLRIQRAKLLGFPTFADFGLDDQMAKTPSNAIKLMTDLVPAATAKALAEAAKMQAVIDAQNGGFKLTAADWDFYAEQVRKAEYDLDDAEVKPYFEFEHVLRDGVFYAANQLYGVTFKERKDLPVYHPDVRVFEVFDKDGKSIALFYGDYYARPNKGGGAWQDSFVDESSFLGTKPVVVNVLNIEKPAPGQPTFVSFDNVSGLFHEFGHALHAIFSAVKYPTSAGVPRDFVEFPSQINEHWALEPKVLANYAKHYQTGAPMPQTLVDKIKKSRTFNQGYGLTEYLGAALLDMAWHALPDGTPQQDVNAFEPAALKRFQIDLAQVPPRYHTTYFSHIWGGGYSAAYYAYLWSEVLDDDAFYWFKENGGMTRANGDRFRDMILSRGGTQDVAVLFRNFRGRDPIVEPLQIERGLKPANE